jgi:cell division protein FtsZ
MTGDSPEKQWQGYAPEDSLAVIKLITIGQKSKRHFKSINPSIVGLECILNDPEILRDNEVDIRDLIENTDMLFVAVFIDEPKELGVTKKILEVAHDLGLPTVAIVLMQKQSKLGNIDPKHDPIPLLVESHSGATLFIPTDPVSEQNNLDDSLGIAAVRGITETITRPGLVGLDYADVRTVMSVKGMAFVGQGYAEGDNRAIQATDQAISNLSLNNIDLSDAETILINMTAGLDIRRCEKITSCFQLGLIS